MLSGISLVLTVLVLTGWPAAGQDAAAPAPTSLPAVTSTGSAPTGTAASNAAAIAAKEAADERFQRLATDLQAVQSDSETLHAKLTSVEQEIQTLRDATARAADNSGIQAIQEELKRLAEKIQEVDKKRMEDKDAIAEQIQKAFAKFATTNRQQSRARPPAKAKAAACRIHRAAHCRQWLQLHHQRRRYAGGDRQSLQRRLQEQRLEDHYPKTGQGSQSQSGLEPSQG